MTAAEKLALELLDRIKHEAVARNGQLYFAGINEAYGNTLRVWVSHVK